MGAPIFLKDQFAPIPPKETDMVSDSLVRDFQRLLGKDRVFFQETDRLTYAYDAAVLEPVLPALVVRPKSTGVLGQVVQLCNDNGLPLTVRGAGTNLSGGTIPRPGGVVVLDLHSNLKLGTTTGGRSALMQDFF
jgi:hypothetical protein